LRLGAEPEQPPLLDLLDAPEVDGLADADVLAVAPPAPEPRPADELVEHAAHAPQRVRVEPAGLAADRLDYGEHRRRRRLHDEPLPLRDQPLLARHLVRLAAARRERARPRRLDLVVAEPLHRE